MFRIIRQTREIFQKFVLPLRNQEENEEFVGMKCEMERGKLQAVDLVGMHIL